MNYNRTVHQIPEGRPIDALLAAYAAKTLAPPQVALVAAHLELKPENRAYVATLEAVHGVFLEELKPVPLAGRDRRLVNIFASPTIETEPATPAPLVGELGSALPRALRHLAGCDLADLPWRKCGSGIKDVLLREDGARARFVSVAPGGRLPVAGECEEAVAALVLAGAASRPTGYYERGDIVFAAPGAQDRPAVEGDVDCVCFVVTEIPVKSSIKPIGRLSRVLNLVIGG